MTFIDKIAPNAATTGPMVVALVYDGLCTFEFASAAIEPGPLRAHGGLTVSTEGGLELLEQADLIVMAGWKGASVPVPAELVAQLRTAWARGARLASICSGAFVLAATGLLDGRRAATHWRCAEALRYRHPSIEVDSGVLYAEEERVFTSAGSAAGMDLMLHLVRADFGVEAANSVARRLVMSPHRSGGQAQFIERPVPADRSHRLAGVLEQVRAELQGDWTVARMAEAAAMSPRTFLRRFTESTAQAPGEWLIAERVAEAQRLLESSSLPVEHIAAEVGFGSVQTLRYHFQARLGLTPREYRRSFAGRA